MHKMCRHCQVVSKPASHSGVPGFKSSHGDGQSWDIPQLYQPSKQILGQQLNSDHQQSPDASSPADYTNYNIRCCWMNREEGRLYSRLSVHFNGKPHQWPCVASIWGWKFAVALSLWRIHLFTSLESHVQEKLCQHPNPRCTYPNPRQSPSLQVRSPDILPPSSPQPGADSVDAVSSVSRASRRGAKRKLWRRGAMRNRRGVDLSRAARGGSDGRNSTMPVTESTHAHKHTHCLTYNTRFPLVITLWPFQYSRTASFAGLRIGVQSPRSFAVAALRRGAV